MLNKKVLPKEDNEIYSIGVRLQPFYNKDKDEWLWIATEFFDDTFHDGNLVYPCPSGQKYEDLFTTMDDAVEEVINEEFLFEHFSQPEIWDEVEVICYVRKLFPMSSVREINKATDIIMKYVEDNDE